MKNLSLSRTIFATAGLVIAGCAAPTMERVPINATYTDQELTFAHAQGTATVSGQAFLRQRGGGIVTCAGLPIVLVPKIDYTATVMQRAVGSRVYDSQWLISYADSAFAAMPPMPEPIKAASKRTVCDVNGKFSIASVPPGEYYATAQVSWQAGTAQGGILVKPIKVADKNIDVQLSL